ncbi:MAG: prepilin-type N-terminal cleavage/methylation domain-containing protein [Alphaproteobacteria bacterium]|nr:prepilin-type N-terminal cleavage/methylation domain-containing protein [Alphaproteobacteria bacterium]
MRGWGTANDQAGFTLMELIVAMTLLGMLMAALLGGLKLGSRVWEASEERLAASARMETVRNFLRSRLGEALPPTAFAAVSDPEAIFLGEPHLLRFAGRMSPHQGGGIYLMELALERRGGGSDLLLRWSRLDGGGEEPTAYERVLVDGVTGFEVAYYDSSAQHWRRDWRDALVLPRLVRIELGFSGDDPRSWPPMIVELMVDTWHLT